jgi:hypothetical protein
MARVPAPPHGLRPPYLPFPSVSTVARAATIALAGEAEGGGAAALWGPRGRFILHRAGPKGLGRRRADFFDRVEFVVGLGIRSVICSSPFPG